jgi:kynurenine formamidase
LRQIPRGFEDVDPRTARRIPLWQRLTASNPIFEGDPEFSYENYTTIPQSGYLVERITSLGTHTGTHISAPAHFLDGAAFLDELDERWTLMPLTVIDVRATAALVVALEDVQEWERRQGMFPAGGCVLLLTGLGALFKQGAAYFADAPGLAGDAASWLFEQRGTIAIGSDTFGPDATADTEFSATSAALRLGGITVENVGAGLAEMRPYGDWIAINGARPHFSGFQVGITGFTVHEASRVHS